MDKNNPDGVNRYAQALHGAGAPSDDSLQKSVDIEPGTLLIIPTSE
jgi:hypothetical protein